LLVANNNIHDCDIINFILVKKGFTIKNVYITEANFRLIFKSLRHKNTFSRVDMIADIAEDKILDGSVSSEAINELFNNFEIQDLFLFKYILKDFNEILNKIDKNRESIQEYIKSQNKQYERKIKFPAYHNDINCKWMKKDFKNIDKTTHQVVYKKNSRNRNFENRQIELDLEDKIKDKYTQLQFYFNFELADQLAKYRYASEYKVDDIISMEKNKKLHQPIRDFHEAKKILKEMMMSFYQKKYNKEVTFHNQLLDSLGFRECSACNIHTNITSDIRKDEIPF